VSRSVLLDLNNNGIQDPLQKVTVTGPGAPAVQITLPSQGGGGDPGDGGGNGTTSASSVTVGGQNGLLADLTVTASLTAGHASIGSPPWNPPAVMLIGPWGEEVTLSYTQSGTLTGDVTDFLDQNANGVWTLRVVSDPAQTFTLRSWSLTLTSGEPLARTDASGHYAFAHLRPGTYTIREVPPPGVTLTSQTSITETAADGQSVLDLNFGEQPPTPQQRYATQILTVVTGAAPDPYQAAQLAEGVNQANLQQTVAPLLQGVAFRTLRIEQLYQRLLHHAPDPTTLQAGLRFLAGGGTIEQLQSQVLASAEYFQLRGGRKGVGFIRALYRDVLGTAADPGVIRTQASTMSHAAARQRLIGRVLRQPAALQKAVQALYALAGLPIDPTQAAVYVRQMQHGTGEDAVLADILSSASYFAST
jgi:hypothetical protein